MFDHEKLRVYQYSLDFTEWVGILLNEISQKISVCEHLDEASTSIPLNIAEGNGKFTSKDRCKYFDIARGSALECASSLDVLVRRRKVEQTRVIDGKQLLSNIVSMLVGLIKSNSDRTFEPDIEYGTNNS
ncbi:MAG: four helix bundle protein [Ignavibacteria bacterium GWA2_35_9]|nr:MAG: four helix bundle protein [Ignavibacteria bacterium GWA2_35_9]OGU46268.1 MAG: four helix bundle protein [Ignavibacteria bacterium GWB2_36_8]OGU51259.1 MAG: four helix bundle protein [Ignavibacteria bacterium GWC2_36_12]